MLHLCVIIFSCLQYMMLNDGNSRKATNFTTIHRKTFPFLINMNVCKKWNAKTCFDFLWNKELDWPTNGH